MNSPTNVFVTENNVELYLSKAYECFDSEMRDLLLRLVVEEETRMGARREHVDNGQRRLDDCKERVQRQREIVRELHRQNRSRAQAEFILETLERTLLLMKDHQRALTVRYRQARL